MLHKEAIISYLNDKTQEGFTGGVKIGFEYGRPSSVAENFHVEVLIPLPDGFDIKKQVTEALNGDFFGTLFFVFKDGQITHFNRIRTFQGKVLDKVILGYADAAPPVRKAVGIRRPANG